MALPVTFTASNGTELNAADAMMVSNTAHTGVMEINSNRVWIRASPAASACYVYDQSPASADYDVQATFRCTSTGCNGGIVGRASKTASTFYLARYNGGNIQLYKFINGTATQLGSNVAQSISINTDYTLKLSMVGSTIKVYWDGVEKISQTDTAITSAGYGGIRINSADQTVLLDNLDITNMSAGNTIAVPAASLTLTGLAPTVAQTAHNTIAVPVGALSLTGFAPSVSNSASNVIEVPAGSLSLTGYEPTVAVSGAGNTIEVPLGALTLAGLAPTVWNYPRIVTPEPLKNNTATALSNETGAVVFVDNPATGELVVKKTGLTTDADGHMAFQDSSLSPATAYRCVFQLASGAEGLATITSQ